MTILSTLPSAGVGALLALMLFGYDLSVIALIGIVLLMGIVKKNAIMMIDFALEAERDQGLSPREVDRAGGLLRFRPIMMTTLAALFGALPLALESGTGSELRNPLGVTIVGGLLLCQLLTLYTTPVIYLYMERLRARLSPAPPRAGRGRRARPARVARLNFSRALHPPADRHHAAGDRPRSWSASSPIASCRSPACRASNSRPSASAPAGPAPIPATMAATVAAPLERRLGEIAGVTEMTSVSPRSAHRASSCSSTCRAASRAPRATCRRRSTPRSATCPATCRRCRRFRKSNPAAAPILILALTSKTAAAERDLRRRRQHRSRSAWRRSPGVAEVTVAGSEQPAIRVRVDPGAARRDGPQRWRTVRTAIANANVAGPLGAFDGPTQRAPPSASTTSCATPAITTRSWSRRSTARSSA